MTVNDDGVDDPDETCELRQRLLSPVQDDSKLKKKKNHSKNRKLKEK